MNGKTEDQPGVSRSLPGRLLLVAGVILLLVFAAWVLKHCRGDAPALSDFTNVAVLPLTNSTGDPLLSYLAAGFSSDLRARLSELHSLQLASQSEAWSQVDNDLSLQQIAQEMGVELLVHGDLSQRAGNLKVVVEVYDARARSVLGTVEHQRAKERLFDLEQRIAKDLASLIGVALSRSERSRLRENATRSLKAYDYYLRGLQYLEDWTNPRGASFAADLLRQAVQLDPQFPRAHADLSKALWRIHHQDHQEQTLTEALAEATQALKLDSSLPASRVAVARLVSSPNTNALPEKWKPDETYRELAADYLLVGELEKAESSLRAAVQLGSRNWRNSYLLAVFLERSGRLDEAASVFEQAAQHAPEGIFWPQEAVVNLRLADDDPSGAISAFEAMGGGATVQARTLIGVGRAYLLAGRPDLAEPLYRRATVLSPQDHWSRRLLGDVLSRLGQVDEAIDQYTAAFELVQDELSNNPYDSELELLATLYSAKAKRCTEALPRAATLRRHLSENAETSYEMALVFSLCGDRRMTLDALRAAVGFGVSPESIQNTREFEWLAGDPALLELLSAPSDVPPRP